MQMKFNVFASMSAGWRQPSGRQFSLKDALEKLHTHSLLCEGRGFATIKRARLLG